MKIPAILFLSAAACFADEPASRLPPVTVTEDKLQEERPVGPYVQPAWTTARRFPTTRVYVQQPPWGFGVEQWWRGRWYRHDGDKQQFQEELEIGLPHRVQLDFYENWVINQENKVKQDNFAVEARWALADWGKIPLNPTIYGEWKFAHKDDPDVYELKLLFGEELAPRWHWGLNLIYEQEVGGARATEYAASQALSYTVLDEKFSIGAEMKVVHESEKGARSNAAVIVEVGPSLQWRPTANSHVDIVPLFGVTDDSPQVEAFVVFGVDFGPGHEDHGRAPVSLQSN